MWKRRKRLIVTYLEGPYLYFSVKNLLKEVTTCLRRKAKIDNIHTCVCVEEEEQKIQVKII